MEDNSSRSQITVQQEEKFGGGACSISLFLNNQKWGSVLLNNIAAPPTVTSLTTPSSPLQPEEKGSGRGMNGRGRNSKKSCISFALAGL